MKNYKNMSDSEIKARINELIPILEGYTDGNWNEAYNEYSRLNAILDERYRERNQADFNAYYKEHIESRTWEEIDAEHWSFYSDWHKDMYGYRPRI